MKKKSGALSREHRRARQEQESAAPVFDLAAHYRHRVTRTTVIMMAVPTIVGVLVGLFVVSPFVFGPVGLLVGAVVPYIVSRESEQAVIHLVHGREVDPVSEARLVNLVDGLCLVAGVHRPHLRIVDGQWPLAMAVSESGSAGTIVVSEGLAHGFDRLEMEAVVAHLISRLRSGEAALATYVVAFDLMSARLGVPALGRWVRRATLEESAILAADLAACSVTRYPPGLVAALDKIESWSRDSARGIDIGVPNATAPLWFAVPVPRGTSATSSTVIDTTSATAVPNVEAFHPPLADRIAICKEI